MDYETIVLTAIAIIDRPGDDELSNLVTSFITLVEARVNRNIRVGRMATRSVTVTQNDSEYYSLPIDFLALRDIEISSGSSGEKTTLQYVNPEQSNNVSFTSGADSCYYTIIANQIQIVGQTPDDMVLEIVYYQKIKSLNDTDGSTWLSTNHPDAYINGLLVEMYSYVKNQEAVSLWEQRFMQSMQEINSADAVDRWSGTALQVRQG